MGMQQLKFDLANMGVYQELTDVMKSIASVKFPKLKKRMEGLRYFGHAVEKISLSPIRLSNPKR
jgi:F0F1-type ATP synthase gamma subunit